MGWSIRRAERSMSKTYLPYDPEQQLLLPAAPPRMAAAGPPGLLHLRRRGPVGPLGHYRPLRGGKAGRPSLPSQDDGQGAALRLLQRRGLLEAYRPASPRGHRLPGAGGQQHAGLPHHLRLPQGPSGGVGGVVPAGTGVVPAGRTGEAGARGPWMGPR